MQIVLLEEVINLGKSGEMVTVKDGYARNYLIPKGLALVYSSRGAQAFLARKKQEAKLKEKTKEEKEHLKELLQDLILAFKVKTKKDTSELYGGISNVDILRELQAKGITIEKSMIHMEEPIRTLGEFMVPIHLYGELEVPIKIVVEKK